MADAVVDNPPSSTMISAETTTATTTQTQTPNTTAVASTKVNFRPPPSTHASPSDFQQTNTKWMAGTWYVTHSTLPMWKSNRNVKITYNNHATIPDAFDNLVEYNPLGSDKEKTVAGVEKPDANIPNAWNWRGKGWLMIASSHWEVLGWGEEDGGWMLTFFQKTLFTPAGIDICVRRREGVSKETVDKIRQSIRDVKDDKAFAELGEEMFEVKHDA